MTKKITIPYFPKELKYVTPLLFGGAIYLIVIGYYVWAPLAALLGVIVLTTAYVTEIDLEKKVCRDYLSFLRLQLNKDEKRFNRIDRIVITKGNYAQTVNTRVQSRTMRWSDYTGTILFDGNDMLELITRTDKQELVMGLREFAQFLEVRIEDRTTGEHYWLS